MKQKLIQLFEHLTAMALHSTTAAKAACCYAREAAYLAQQIQGMGESTDAEAVNDPQKRARRQQEDQAAAEAVQLASSGEFPREKLVGRSTTISTPDDRQAYAHTPMKGKLIVIEGMDGVGKTTQVQSIVSALFSAGVTAVAIREPGGTPLGEKLRTILKSEECHSLTPAAQMLLFAAARAQNVAERIKPLLEAGTWVIMDRFSPSTQVYQGVLNKLPDAMTVDAIACQGLVPDMTFILDMDVERASARRAEGEKDMWDRMDMCVVRAAYLEHASKWDAIVLDADKSSAALTEEITAHLKPEMPSPARCPVCKGTGWRKLDRDHDKVCEHCCKHDQGWWELHPIHGRFQPGKDNHVCSAGCGTMRRDLTNK